mmetsp:Transcript_4199/g.4923  ORF Transcript_4199/g.4923 Transcript_4199/m.4923 type:complete len:179 (-) Transcript_4199:233-769(-)|eukprot:CAMPEP_0185773940 /NCGR_PEP_ID=MMETSP1174-20130828/75815_1 /TAXON_ID=35687 /ORGANISM="Dictyocha speculum, Strain CCMP1381" /LENGTH=178 /DNA_ID=CAMNT_0028460847 /DNA_START=57 /DNA_END=590 /DNA_ORIENTATION=+
MADFSLRDLQSLSTLLQPEDEEEQSISSAITPASFGLANTPKPDPETSAYDPKAIWQDDEVPLEGAILEEEFSDARPSPSYDMFYKQDVMSEDVFLGIGDKTPGTSDCTHMAFKISFPGHTLKDLDLEITKQSLRVESDTLKLALYLPLPGDSDRGSAKWDQKKELLTVVLPIIRDDW